MTENDDIEKPAASSGEPPTEEAPTRELPPGESTAEQGAEGSPRRFLRSRDDRVVAGVAGGLGRYFDIDPVIIRIAFAVSILFGGLGLIAYIAAVLFVPSDDGTGVPVSSGRGRGVLQVLGIIALAFVALAAFGALVAGAAFATGLGYGLPIAVLIVVIGIALAVLSFRGGARWLIVPALALTIGVGVASAADLDLEGGVGEREYRPASAAAIPADGYELGVGSLAVDLRDVDWSPRRIIDLDVRVGAGEAIVAVPPEVCVAADGHVGAGELRIAGQRADGLDVELATAEGSRATPQLRLDADVDLGRIVVVNDDDVQITGVGDRWDHGLKTDDEFARTANARACGR